MTGERTALVVNETRRIFISYRQEDTQGWPVVLRDELVRAFGEDCVFFAPDTLELGLWREQIDRALTHSKVVLVLIGKHWLTAVDIGGRLRLSQSDDVHRQEIEMALASPATTVVPVLVGGASMPRREELPDSIAPLSDRQARQLSDASDRRRVDLKALISDIAAITGLSPKSPGGPRSRLRTTGTLLLATILTSLAVMIAAQTLGFTITSDSDMVSGIFIIVFTVLLVIWRWRARANEAR